MFATAFGMSVVSSMTMTAAEPSIDFAAATPSKSIGTSMISSPVSIGAEEPPGMTAFTFRPSRIPPHIARRSLKRIPIGAS